MDTLQKRLKHARKIRGLSQKLVAEPAGMEQGTYSELESGKSRSTTKLAEIAQALRVNLHWLATGEGDMDDLTSIPVQPVTTPLEQTDPAEAFLLSRFRDASPERRDQALTVLLNGLPQKAQAPTMRELLAEWKEGIAQELSVDLDRFFQAKTQKEKNTVQLEIGGRVIQMFDQRQRPGEPPDGVDRRRDGSKG